MEIKSLEVNVAAVNREQTTKILFVALTTIKLQQDVP
jgi:hypothetical protein